MKIAIPTTAGKMSSHFGQCEEFAVYDTDGAKTSQTLTPPEHQPGSYPRFLSSRGVDVVIAGGMGGRAQDLFAEIGITVVSGAQGSDPAAIVEAYLRDALETGDNLCDH